MARLWKALMMLVAAALLASCGGGGGGLIGGGCVDDDVSVLFLYGYGLQGTVGVEMRVEPNITGVPSQCRSDMRFSVDSGSLPPGISLNERSGVISGVPTQGGRYPFTIRLTLKGFDGGVNADIASVIRDPAEATFAAWEVMSYNGHGFHDDFRIGAIGSDLYVVGNNGRTTRLRTFRSVDSGRTWTELNVGPPIHVEEFALASDGNHIYLSGGARARVPSSAVWRFDGTTWTLMTADGAFPPRTAHAMLSHRGALYILGGYAADRKSLADVWRSTDGGATWTQLSASAFPSRSNTCALSDGKGLLYVLGGSASPTFHRRDMWQSRDDGVNWEQVPISENSPLVNALERGSATCSVLNGRMVYVSGYVYPMTISSDNGRDWLMEPHVNWLSGASPGAVTVDGHMYVLTGEGTSQRHVIRTKP